MLKLRRGVRGQACVEPERARVHRRVPGGDTRERRRSNQGLLTVQDSRRAETVLGWRALHRVLVLLLVR